MNRWTATLVVAVLAAALRGRADEAPRFWASTEAQDYAVARQEVFEFTKKPTVTREGDRVSISFASKAYCDATIAIERGDGIIVRHLASGVLGPKAPPPFQTNALVQTVVWDGKNNEGVYVDDKSALIVRVSLGLQPRFEKALDWFPKRRVAGARGPAMVAQPEGVYVYEGGGIESIRLFGHDGKYIRTIYPFPSDKLNDVKDLAWRKFADGWQAPAFLGFWDCTLLMGGRGRTDARWGTSAEGFAVGGGQIASISERICRMRTDGTTGALGLYGPAIAVSSACVSPGRTGEKVPHVPKSAVFSPDGKWLYLTGDYQYLGHDSSSIEAVRWPETHAVYRMEFAGDKSPEVWLGGKPGRDDQSFNEPASLCVDAEGRVYVADFRNDRVQIFSPDRKLLKSLPVDGPAALCLHHKTGELYVFSWTLAMSRSGKAKVVPETLRIFRPFESGQPKLEIRLPLKAEGYWSGLLSSPQGDDRNPFRMCLDSWTEPPTLWAITEQPAQGKEVPAGIRRFAVEGGKLRPLESWNEETRKEVKRPAISFRQWLHVDPRSGVPFVFESFDVFRMDPNSGASAIVKLPHFASEMAFDTEGHILLRCDRTITRFDLGTMREVPFDYGEERKITHPNGVNWGPALGALVLPGNLPGNWKESGFGVNAKGEIVIHCCNTSVSYVPATRKRDVAAATSKPYTPQIYPGRHRFGEIHIFDKHGKPIATDAAGQGAPSGHNTLIDARGDVYFYSAQDRRYDGKQSYPLTGCIMKFKRGQGRFLSPVGDIPLEKAQWPGVPPHFGLDWSGCLWVQDVEWVYPFAGFARNAAPCTCWRSQFALDLFGRSFIPATIRNQIAVLDTNGNLILNIGRTGNADDGVPLVEDLRYRAEKPRAIGGDETALFYVNSVATDTDRRLFADDMGNSRIISVKLGYHAEERVALKDVRNAGNGKEETP
jgi:sugar lactone lactonase YvrE